MYDLKVIVRHRPIWKVSRRVSDSHRAILVRQEPTDSQLYSFLVTGFSNVIELDLSSNRIDKLEANLFLHLAQLRYFELVQLTQINSNLFKGCNNLVILNLSSNNLSCIYANRFSDLVNLEELNLSQQIRLHWSELLFKSNRSIFEWK